MDIKMRYPLIRADEHPTKEKSFIMMRRFGVQGLRSVLPDREFLQIAECVYFHRT